MLTNQRLIFKGDGSIEISVQNISSVESGGLGSMLVTQKDGTKTKYLPGMHSVKTWIQVVSETINSGENSTAKEEDDHSGGLTEMQGVGRVILIIGGSVFLIGMVGLFVM